MPISAHSCRIRCCLFKELLEVERAKRKGRYNGDVSVCLSFTFTAGETVLTMDLNLARFDGV